MYLKQAHASAGDAPADAVALTSGTSIL